MLERLVFELVDTDGSEEDGEPEPPDVATDLVPEDDPAEDHHDVEEGEGI